MDIGRRIKERRKELKLSVDELAKCLNKNRATIYRYEKGEIENMPLDILEPLSKALQTTPQYLMGWKEPSSSFEEFSRELGIFTDEEHQQIVDYAKFIISKRKYH